MAAVPYNSDKKADYLDAEVTGHSPLAGAGEATPSKHSLDGDDEDAAVVGFYDLPLEERRKERKFLWKLDLVYVTVAMVAFVFKVRQRRCGSSLTARLSTRITSRTPMCLA